MEHDIVEFYNLATKEFGEKFSIKPVLVSDEIISAFNEQTNSHITREDVAAYRQVWLLEPVCPKCNSELDGLFGSFDWEVVHGCGRCTACNETHFRYYHYIGSSKFPIQAYALIGF
jgi:hypothetical protein